jgi:hypothetical protein
MNNTDCVVSSSPKAETAKITDKGPKNTNPKVAIPSARYALGLTIMQDPRQYPYKTFDMVL